MLENGLVIITVIVVFLLVCSCMGGGRTPLDRFRDETFTYKRSNPAHTKYGDLKVECDQYPSFSHNVAPDTIRIPCGATATRKLIDAAKDETYGQEGLCSAKDAWDSNMASNLYCRAKNGPTVTQSVDNMAAKSATHQRRNQVEGTGRRSYN